MIAVEWMSANDKYIALSGHGSAVKTWNVMNLTNGEEVRDSQAGLCVMNGSIHDSLTVTGHNEFGNPVSIITPTSRKAPTKCRIHGVNLGPDGTPSPCRISFASFGHTGHIDTNSVGEWYFYMKPLSMVTIRINEEPRKLWFQAPDVEEVDYDNIEGEIGHNVEYDKKVL